MNTFRVLPVSGEPFDIVANSFDWEDSGKIVFRDEALEVLAFVCGHNVVAVGSPAAIRKAK